MNTQAIRTDEGWAPRPARRGESRDRRRRTSDRDSGRDSDRGRLARAARLVGPEAMADRLRSAYGYGYGYDAEAVGGRRGSRDRDREFGPGGGPGPGGFGGFGPGFGPGGFGPGGFGPGGFGPGGFGPGGFGRGHGGRGGHGPFGRGRRGRGNVRAAILALLAEEPRHGYAIMTELAERSGGLWRPSPGSVYPVLQQLQDEGLVTAEETEGRRVFSLTEAGRRTVQENPEEFAEPWTLGAGPRERMRSLFEVLAGLGLAAREVARHGTDAQVDQARAVLDEARRSMYRILAGDPVDPQPRWGTPESGTAAPADVQDQPRPAAESEDTGEAGDTGDAGEAGSPGEPKA